MAVYSSQTKRGREKGEGSSKPDIGDGDSSSGTEPDKDNGEPASLTMNSAPAETPDIATFYQMYVKDQQRERNRRQVMEEKIAALEKDRDGRRHDMATLGNLLRELAVLFAKSSAQNSFVSVLNCCPQIRLSDSLNSQLSTNSSSSREL